MQTRPASLALAPLGCKVAVVLPVELRADALHRDLVPIAYGFKELGYDVTVYAPAASTDTPGLRLVVERDGLTSQAFWRREAPIWALVLTWLGCGDILEALKCAGATVISKGDTDGLVSARHHPRANWQRMVLHKRGAIGRGRAAWHLAKRVGPLHSQELQALTRSLAAADALVVESQAAKRAIERTLASGGYGAHAKKIVVRWNPVQSAFSRMPLVDARDRLIVAVARWDDPQKDAKLLRAALTRILTTDRCVRVEVLGPGSEFFDGIDSDRVRTLGRVANDQLVDVFARARVIGFASRWEGLPIAALEALACGCSVVGTRIGAFLEIEAAGGGRAARRRRSDLAQALSDELRLWDLGHRTGTGVGSAWRPRVDRRCVARAYADLFLGLGPPAAEC